MTMTASPDAAITKAAERLRVARDTGCTCAPIRDLIAVTDLSAAYRVQQGFNESRLTAGARVVGRKIGLTSVAVQQQLGVDQPDFGVLFDDMVYASGDVVPMDRLLQPRAEAEIAFVLSADLADGDLDPVQIRGAIDYAVAAIEICDSRIGNWDIKFADTVADNASSGLYVLGDQRVRLDGFDTVAAAMSMAINGAEVSTGTGADCLGDPLAAVAWLAQAAREYGEPLRAGQVILSGAMGPMRPVGAGDEVTVRISGLGEVSASFSSGEGK
ncbi:2-keto-4-pentenoate hydratase [Jongsikchunia kroppenstedtii]|uniref:2-keto-4-pentenoate hydratase n=1 Tax=Jongsikchunia kroppenstedtii TaxID=1121721 RepID=UPI00039FD113|nr:fumarylacetoacetate hydrolase family protein [Jongsikchunia kroppenstedtii]